MKRLMFLSLLIIVYSCNKPINQELIKQNDSLRKSNAELITENERLKKKISDKIDDETNAKKEMKKTKNELRQLLTGKTLKEVIKIMGTPDGESEDNDITQISYRIAWQDTQTGTIGKSLVINFYHDGGYRNGTTELEFY